MTLGLSWIVSGAGLNEASSTRRKKLRINLLISSTCTNRVGCWHGSRGDRSRSFLWEGLKLSFKGQMGLDSWDKLVEKAGLLPTSLIWPRLQVSFLSGLNRSQFVTFKSS